MHAPVLFILKSFPLTQTFSVSFVMCISSEDTRIKHCASLPDRNILIKMGIVKMRDKPKKTVWSVNVYSGSPLSWTPLRYSVSDCSFWPWIVCHEQSFLFLYISTQCVFFIMTESMSNYWAKHCKHAHKHSACALWGLKTWIASSSSFSEKAQSFYPWKHTHTHTYFSSCSCFRDPVETWRPSAFGDYMMSLN